jgi:hypothetical protein
MQKHPILLSALALLLWTKASQASGNSETGAAKVQLPISAKSPKTKVITNADGSKEAETKAVLPQPAATSGKKPVDGKSKPAIRQETLGEAFITQNTLQVYLDRPVSVSLYNARGQLLYHFDSFRPLETLPLKGVNAGFLYITLRAGLLETTQKLVYTGK